MRATTFISATKSKTGWKMINFVGKGGGCTKLATVDLLHMIVHWDWGWSSFAPRMMGYKV
ncbi:hypothetical protein DVH24_015032 [Malus domestica]|uniref:Uncharacterized protein n=1 Tax=Malus domestica TaxID=3750 RepID=A0A498K7R9_MALDO|nr:hypothetical protein DVH24_015032 [Malus domestica]